ncbi:MAG: hypothetical protein M3P50_02000 [Actinomycetota bacterium]|nr:hypothetical protein [Actinomycetota bacterium]
MDFELGPALLAGLIAGAIMEGPVYMQKAMGLPVKQNIFRTWGQNLLGIKGTAKIPSLDPATGAIRAQGFAYRNYGALDVATSLVGHLMFGLSTGILYGLLHSMGGSGDAF